MKTAEVAETIFQMRDDGLTYRQITQMTGVSRHTIGAILKGKYRIDVDEGPEPPPIFDKPEKTMCPQCRNQVYLPAGLAVCWACYVRNTK